MRFVFPSTAEGTDSGLGRSSEFEFEHFHRYLFATQFCAGRDVLVMTCGEGHGAVVLSQVALSVLGVDIAQQVVDRADAAYGTDNLNFLLGSHAQIPADAATIDVVVSFDTFERVDERQLFLQEVRRVLRPGGIFIVAIPDSAVQVLAGLGQESRLRGLGRTEFDDLLAEHFAHRTLGIQKVTSGSLIAPATGAWRPEEIFRRIDLRRFVKESKLRLAPHLIAICSTAPLPDIRWGLLDDAAYLASLQVRLIEDEAIFDEEIGLSRENVPVNLLRGLEARRMMTLGAERDRHPGHLGISRARLDVLGKERAELLRELRRHKAHAEAVEKTLHTVVGSTSWKMTRPLRGLMRMLFGGAHARRIVLSRGMSMLRASIGPRKSIGVRSQADQSFSRGQRARRSVASTRPLVLIATHDCSQSGGPMLMLNVTRELLQRGTYEVVVIAKGGGVLASEFARLVPVHILAPGGASDDAADALAALMPRLGKKPSVALCNTILTADFIPVLRAAQVPVVSLVHELPTSISHYGEKTIRTIDDSANA